MRRGWFVERDRFSEVGEGSDPARQKALLLAEVADAEFIDTLIKIKTALDSFGGKFIVGAKRVKVHPVTNERIEEGEVGVHHTIAYLAEYDATPVRGEAEEPPTTFADAEAAFERSALTPAPEPEPVEA